ncbi:hypothetical protein V5N11_033178 [Cardamine amara subsp. amara]|uniref:NYN domain-containing protein n=1 Tax=Cardamine amara subsp. amara TaxID=228776 RepID=A0ABD0ZJU2_CARAN
MRRMKSEWDVLLSKEIFLSKEEAEAKTSVWWDMKSFPVPSGYEAGQVAECIKSSLEKSGFRGPVTITAYGDLQQTPEHVLRALSSTGITLKHSYSS